MPIRLQEYLAMATEKAAADLETAMGRIPEDKQNWRPSETSRTALDQAAECALLAGYTADMIVAKAWTMGSDFTAYEKEKSELVLDAGTVLVLLRANAAKVAAAIRAAADDDMEVSIVMPWGPMTIAQTIVYPFWNMTYHEGQINYIASILGCLN